MTKQQHSQQRCSSSSISRNESEEAASRSDVLPPTQHHLDAPRDELGDPDYDALDVFEDALGSLFDHHQAASGIPGSKSRWAHRLLPPRSDDAASAGVISYWIPPNSSGDTRLYAHYQWDSGKAMARCLVESSLSAQKESATGAASLVIAAADLRSLGKEDAILELGAGTGLPSLVCARLLSDSTATARIVCTDYPSAPLVESLRKSVEGEKADVVVRGLDWADAEAGKEIRSLAPQGYTLVLAADCLWLIDSQAHLLSTLTAQLARTPRARALIFAGFHTTAWPVRSFLERAQAVGLEPDWEAEHEGRWLLGPTVGDEDFGGVHRWRGDEGQTDDVEQRSKWSVCLSLRWKEIL